MASKLMDFSYFQSLSVYDIHEDEEEKELRH